MADLSASITQTHRTVRAQYIGGPTALIEIGGVRLLTDPTFDAPGSYDIAPGRRMTKLLGPAVSFDELGSIDVVLLSHDQHFDNLDRAGRDVLARVPTVLTTVAGARRIGGSAQAMERWTDFAVARPAGGTLTITSVPAQHGPDGTDHLTGEVTGFVLRGDGVPVVYVSGDNASLRVVEEIAARVGPIDIAVLFAGAARTALIPGANLTLSSEDAAIAAKRLRASSVFVLHFEGWGHFTEGRTELTEAFRRAGLAPIVHVAEPGESIVL